MFDDLADRFRDHIAEIAEADRAALLAAETDAEARRAIQQTLLRELRAQAGRAGGDAGLERRVELVDTQLRLTQGWQELELGRRIVGFLLGKLVERGPAAEALSAMASDFDRRLQQVAAERAEVAIRRLRSANAPTGRPPADDPLDPAALAVQQETLLRIGAGIADQSEWRASVALAGRMVEAHALGNVVATRNGATAPFADRLAGMTGRSGPSCAEILQLGADVQRHVEDLLHDAVRRRERSKQDKLVDEAVARQLAQPGRIATADPRLRPLFEQAGSMDRLRRSIAGQHKLEQILSRLSDLARNEIVQGLFLPAGSVGGDRFLAATESASGDLNGYENLGKFTYHVTALANILRTPGSGIAKSGLWPEHGELGAASTPSHAPISEASVVNRQNKIVTATRPEMLRMFVDRQEDLADRLLQESDGPAKAAQASAVILRFPIRAGYLGKFVKDPTHFTEDLQLLDDTIVPPDDIEVLMHREWVPVTNDAFLAVFQEMFAGMLDS